jgi:hypothetical protein
MLPCGQFNCYDAPVEWSSFMSVQLHRVQQRMRDHERTCVAVLAFLKQYGFGPSDPLVIEMDRSLVQARASLDAITAAITYYTPATPSPGWRERWGAGDKSGDS